MNSLKKILTLTTVAAILLGLMASQDALAAKKKESKPRRFPNGCRELGAQIHAGQLTLTPTHKEDIPQSLFFVHNLSSESILLKVNADRKASRYSPSYENIIRPNQWGAFAVDLPSIAFACYTTSRGIPDEQIDCAHRFDICQYNNVKFSDANGGNYWVVKSDDVRGAIRIVSREVGILLRW